MLPIDQFCDHFQTIWNESQAGDSSFKRTYSRNEQEERERFYNSFQEKLNGLSPKRRLSPKQVSNSFFPVFRQFLQQVFEFEEQHLDVILSSEFKKVSRDFYSQARKFAPDLSMENIYQGLRNVWIMNGLQLVMGLTVEITPSVFAYSMMYPYSDNYLDDPKITRKDKEEFSKRFKDRLEGRPITPSNLTEKQLFSLVEMIEEQYDRISYQSLYQSLYAIHEGQTKSIYLSGDALMDQDQVLRIGFEKGGTSVLADGYLVAGKLTRQEEQALFGYGVYLQVLDDIQDVQEDSQDSVSTIFTRANKSEMGELLAKSLCFGRSTMKEMNCFQGIRENDFIGLMNRSIETMMVESVGLNFRHFEESFTNKLEHHSPLSYAFIREKHKKAKSQRRAIFEKYFEKNGLERVT